jgi:GTPase SAR1 family protein
MSRLKLIIVGPQKAGKSTLANILGDLSDGPSTLYRPTIGCRYKSSNSSTIL